MKGRTILVTGSNGLTGAQLLRVIKKSKELKKANIVLANRKHSPAKEFKEELIQDLAYKKDWEYLIARHEPDQILNISNIRHSSAMLEAIRTSKIKPKIYIIGTTAIYSRHKCCRQEYKSLENKIKSYDGEYCILRPSMIYGSDKDKNMSKVVRFIKKYKFFPIFGRGQNLMQPVYYKDLANAIGTTLEKNLSVRAIDLAGAHSQTYESIIKEVFISMKIRPRIIRLPIESSKQIVKNLPKVLSSRIPVTYEQLIRLQEDKAFNIETARKLLGYNPVSFNEGIRNQVNESNS